MEASRLVDELAARVRLAKGAATVLLLVAKDEHPVDEVRSPLLALLRAAGPFRVEDLGKADAKLGPRAWVGKTPAGSADAFVLVLEPGSPLAVRSFGRRLNGEREHLRELGGPLLLLMNADDDRALRQIAPDFFTWIAHTYELPTVGEILAYARRTLGVLGGTTTAAAGTLSTSSESSPPVRFLHLSDVHFKTGAATAYDRNKVLHGLLERMRKDREKSPIDLIFFTGDLANTGAESDYEGAVVFLRELLDVTGVHRDCLFTVPGNHDVDRKVGRWILRTLGSGGDATDFFVEPESRRLHEQKFAAYRRALADLLGEARPLGLRVGGDAVEVVKVRGIKLAVASFNSAWFATADDDIEKLWLGEANVDLAAQRIERENDVTAAVALMHHPIEYLSDVERSTVEKYLERSFDLVLRGHLHRDKAKSVITGRGGYVELAAPAAYQGSQWPNGCFVGEIHPLSRALRVRAYQFGAGADPWTLDPSVFPDDEDGSHTFALRERRRSGALTRGIPAHVTGSLLGEMAASDRAFAIGDINEGDIRTGDIFSVLESSGGRLPARTREAFVKQLVDQIPPPPHPIAPWGREAFEALLRRLADCWLEHRGEWLDAFGPNATTYQLFANAFFERQSGQPVVSEALSQPRLAGLRIGAEGDQAVVEIRMGNEASAQHALQQIQGYMSSRVRLGAILWFQPDRPREDQGVKLYATQGDATVWLVSL